MKKTTLICTLILVSLLSGCASNNASQPVSSQDTSASLVTSSAPETTTESKVETPSETENPGDVSQSETSSENEAPKVFEPQMYQDKSFWEQFGDVSYDDKTISFKNDFDSLRLCKDESIGDEISERIVKQWKFSNIVDFPSGYFAIKDADKISNSKDFEEFEKNYLIDGKYYPTNPDYFGFTDMKGFYDKACELYTGFDYDNFTSFIPEYYAEVDGKLCVTSDRLGERGSDARLIDPLQAKLLLIYDGDNDDSIICIAANPVYDEVTFKEIIDYKFCAYRYVKTDDGIRCKVKSTIAKFGTEDSFNCSNLYEL